MGGKKYRTGRQRNMELAGKEMGVWEERNRGLEVNEMAKTSGEEINNMTWPFNDMNFTPFATPFHILHYPGCN